MEYYYINRMDSIIDLVARKQANYDITWLLAGFTLSFVAQFMSTIWIGKCFVAGGNGNGNGAGAIQHVPARSNNNDNKMQFTIGKRKVNNKQKISRSILFVASSRIGLIRHQGPIRSVWGGCGGRNWGSGWLLFWFSVSCRSLHS